jgi:hypothetical protein
MYDFKIEFKDGEGNGEMYDVSLGSYFVYVDSEPVGSYVPKDIDSKNKCFSIRLLGDNAALPDVSFSFYAVAKAILTAYLLKRKTIERIELEQDESKTTAYALLMSCGDGSKFYLNEGDSLYTAYVNNKPVRLFRTREEADFAGKIQKLRNPHTQVETVLLNLK